MKRIAFISFFVLSLIALILFVPIPRGSYDDGGTREYEALTYKLVCWNRLTGDGVYHKTRIYWGADKHLPIDELYERETPYMPTVDDPPIANAVNFDAQYVRTDGYHEEAIYPAVTVICSTVELNRYYQQYKNVYDLERRADPASDSTIGFLDACDRYDDVFFKEHALILIRLEEPSGSIRHKITAVQQDIDNRLTVSISPIVPEIGTDDMAQWHIFVEMPLEFADASNITIAFPPKTDVDDASAYTEALYQNQFAEVMLPLPDGWDYTAVDDGLYVHPKGQKGRLHLSYIDGFGVCGTGLRCDTITLGGYEAERGTYDDHDIWDYIVLPQEWYSVGDYVVLNEGADAWWDEFGDEAMTILDSIRIYEKITMEDEAIAYAKDVCTVEYEIILAKFDTAQAVWKIIFMMDDLYTDGGGQTVTVDGFTGEILEIEYGE